MRKIWEILGKYEEMWKFGEIWEILGKYGDTRLSYFKKDKMRAKIIIENYPGFGHTDSATAPGSEQSAPSGHSTHI